MRRVASRFAALGALVALVAALTAGGVSAAGAKKLVEGTVFDTTCATVCAPGCPPPPHCGPVMPQSTGSAAADIVCAQRQIVCPLSRSRGAGPEFCVQGQPCGVVYPLYTGEGAVVTVRKRGSSTAMTTLPIGEGHFKIRLAPGEYVLRPYLPEPRCWSGEPVMTKITTKLHSPVPVTLDVSDSCVLHAD